ncbi:MAG: RNA polymerase sigma factor [Chloroflexota bacterium]
MPRELVVRAREGDHDAFSELASASIERLLRLSRLIVRDDDRAQDAVQDALVTAWLNIRGLRDPDRFDAWLHRLVVRSCYRAAGHERRRRVVEVALLPIDHAAVPDTQASVAIRDQLDRGFARLPVHLRAVLVVHHYLSLRDQEAADMLDIPLGTMKSRLSRATAAMRAALEAEERAATATQESMA